MAQVHWLVETCSGGYLEITLIRTLTILLKDNFFGFHEGTNNPFVKPWRYRVICKEPKSLPGSISVFLLRVKGLKVLF